MLFHALGSVSKVLQTNDFIVKTTLTQTEGQFNLKVVICFHFHGKRDTIAFSNNSKGHVSCFYEQYNELMFQLIYFLFE